MPDAAPSLVRSARQPRPLRRRRAAPLVYADLVETAAGQLDTRRLPGGRAPEQLVVLPVVGFGGQSASVLPDAVALLTAAAGGSGVVLALVNRPASRSADATAGWLRDWARRHPEAPLLIAELSLPQRPRLGELRQLAVSALERAAGPMPAHGRVVLADDDVVELPADSFDRLSRALDTAGLATGPVLFDTPELPVCLLPELWLGDLFRALLVDRQFARLEQDPGSVATEAVESLVLSTHLAVRRDVLDAIGGLHDLNELTELVRDALTTPPPAGLRAVCRSAPLDARAGRDPVEELLTRAVRVHARRALAAYASADVPTVMQWNAARLRTSSVDPVRLSTPVWEGLHPLNQLGQAARRQALSGVGRHLGLVLDHVRPTVADAVAALELLGLERHQVDLAPPGPDGSWRLGIRDSSGLVERAVALQRLSLDRIDEARTADTGAW